MSSLGNLIWESPTLRPAPKIPTLVVAVLLVLLGLAIAIGVGPELMSGPLDGATMGAFGMILLLTIGGGLGIFYAAFFSPPPKGVLFFERGVEYGTPCARKSVEYRDLAAIEFERITEAKRTRDKALSTAGLVLSAVAANPAGIGYRLSQLNAEKVESFAVVTPRGESAFRVALFAGLTDRIESAVRQARSP